MKPLDRKLWRELRAMAGQVITIALVVASGITSLVALQGTWSSLLTARDRYYATYRFGDLFVELERAPLHVASALDDLGDRAGVHGVAEVYPRIKEHVRVPLSALSEPAIGQIISIPDSGEPPLNRLHLRAGRWPAPGITREVMVLESFAQHHDLAPGDALPVVLNGRLERVQITGIVLSPELVFAAPVAGFFADEERFAALWMRRAAMESAFDMEGAFNDVVLRLHPNASRTAVAEAVDRVLEPYGGLGAVPRARQTSNETLVSELAQLRQFALVTPAIFLAVAAFLVNVVLSRLMLLQRVHIASLKAMGYANRTIAAHYLKLVAVLVSTGTVLGLAGGYGLGGALIALYARYFHFPSLDYVADPRAMVISVAVSLGAALAGAGLSIASAARLPPAQAMQPPAPPLYRPTLLERAGALRWLGPAGRMVMRELLRRPVRLGLSVVGIALAVGIMVVARFAGDAFDTLIEEQFYQAMREDVLVTFDRVQPMAARREIAHLPGVLGTEALRAVPVRMRHRQHFRDVEILGYPPGGTLRRVLDQEHRVQPIPPAGIMLTAKLAEVLGLEVGDLVRVEAREGERKAGWVRVAALAEEPFGLRGHMALGPLWRLLGEDQTLSMVLVALDPMKLDAFQAALRDLPDVLGSSSRDRLVQQFRRQSAETTLGTTWILTLLACTVAVGVVYNNARIALAMRSRSLASLRVLGFNRREISTVLLGELAIQVVLAIPLGLVIGTGLTYGITATAHPEQVRLPVVISSQSYAFAVTVTLAASAATFLWVRRRLDRLDLIAVLKTRE